MIVGFLGKGGSGKSTLSTGMVNFLRKNNNTVLAVDADHNMDLSYNLGFKGDGPYIGGTFLPLREEFGIDIETPTDEIFTGQVPERRFSFTTPDNYSAKYVHKLDENLHIMMSGPQSDLVLYGSHCSHSLAAPLKIYLPLLDLKNNEMVVVDEKASVDAVSTGIPTGFDLAVIVTEPRHHSLRVAKQIKDMLDWYNVPSVTILNKCNGENDKQLFIDELGCEPFVITETALDPIAKENTSDHVYQTILEKGLEEIKKGPSRLERTISKYKRNIDFLNKK